MLTILIATGNPHKVKEFRRLFRELPIRWVSLDRFPEIPEVIEDGKTFEANAIKKAVEVSRHTILPVIADDSGLEVKALEGAPGIYSARFAGPQRDDHDNNLKVLELLEGQPKSKRGARFVCVLSIALGGKLLKSFEGTCSGTITNSVAGRGGFGYDKIFVPRGLAKRFSQVTANTKDTMSHRTRAAHKAKHWLEKQFLVKK